jgi:hypothetical protein
MVTEPVNDGKAFGVPVSFEKRRTVEGAMSLG